MHGSSTTKVRLRAGLLSWETGNVVFLAKFEGRSLLRVFARADYISSKVHACDSQALWSYELPKRNENVSSGEDDAMPVRVWRKPMPLFPSSLKQGRSKEKNSLVQCNVAAGCNGSIVFLSTNYLCLLIACVIHAVIKTG
jgi:hypothetical protein